MHGDAPRFLRASVAVTIAALVIAARQLLSPALPRHRGLDLEATQDIDRVIAQQPRTNPYLVYLGDKSILWNDARTAFLMYAVRGRSCVALGDPVGPPDAVRDLIARERAQDAGTRRPSSDRRETPSFAQAVDR